MKPIDQIAQHENALLDYATTLTQCRHEAKDVIQEMYIRLLNHSFDNQFDAKKYQGTLRMIIKQVFISRKRKTAQMQRALYDYGEVRSASVEVGELRQVLGQFLWSLNKYDRYLLYLRAIEGYGIQRMEQITSINRGSIQYSIWKSKQKIKKLPQKKQAVLKKALRKKSNL